MKLFSGILLGLLVLLFAGAVVIGTGAVDMASKPPSSLEMKIGQFALDQSVDRRAPDGSNPFANGESAVEAGLDHYRENCVPCHGIPGIEETEAEFAEGLYPGPPDLSLERTQSRSDGDLFWITKNGIRFTGMPAFGPTHSDEEVWKIVAFLRRLPHLDDDQREELSEPGGEHHHHEEEHAESID